MRQYQLSKREGFTPPFQLTEKEKPDEIAVCFTPNLKLLCAEWVQRANSENLRHAIRLFSRIAAVLRPELLLIAIPAPFQVSEADLRWIDTFMQTALRQSPLKKIARVIPSMAMAQQLQEGLTYQSPAIQCANFDTIPAAQKWLLGDRIGELTEENSQRIPLQFSIGHIKRFIPRLTQPTKHSKPQTPKPNTQAQEQLLDICTDFVAISIDHRKEYMQIQWKKSPSSRQYRYGMIKAARALVEHKLPKLLLNNQRIGILTLEDQGWLVSMAQKMLPESNLQKLAVVTSANALQQMSSEYIGKRLQQASLKHQVRYFLLEDEALNWLLHE